MTADIPNSAGASMNDQDIAAYLAALIIQWALDEGGISATRDEFFRDVCAMHGLQVSQEEAERAVTILRDCQILTTSSDPLAGQFFAISTNGFEIFKQKVQRDLEEYERIVKSAPDEHAGVNRAEDQSYRFLDLYNKWKPLKNYASFGDSWISEVLKRLRENDPAENIANRLPIRSETWTGLSKKIGQAEKIKILSKIEALKLSIDQSDLEEADKKNAIARTEAIEKLLEAPDTPWREVVEILNSKYLCAFLNTAAIIQIIFGT